MRYLALDIGEIRIGIAVSDKDGRIASPIAVLSAAEVMQQAPSFRRILEDWEPEHLVVGLPKTLAGEMGPQAQAIQAQAVALAEDLHLPLTFVDERLSSKEAKRTLAEGGLSQKDMRGKVDKVAAALFLQSFLDATDNTKPSLPSSAKESTHKPSAQKDARASAPKHAAQENARANVSKQAAGKNARASAPKHAAQKFSHSSAPNHSAQTLFQQKLSHLTKVPRRVRFVFIGIVAVFLVALIGMLAFCHPKTHAIGETVTVQIVKGAGGDTIAQELLAASLIDDPRDYYKAASDLNATTSIQAGTYRFVVGTPIKDIVEQLMRGPNTSANRVTIPEGSTVKQTAAAVEKALGIAQADFLAEAKASNFSRDFDFLQDAAGTQQDSLEGYLWPSTYDFTGEAISTKTVIARMLEEFKEQTQYLDWDGARAHIQETYGLTFSNYDFIKMSSLIQKEATTQEDQALVSSVFYNRLAASMALQSDATMAYSLGHAPSADDLKQQDLYNTYLNQGLPPTPICSPSLEFIDAALNPAQTDYYFFLIIDEPTYTNHTFSRTYEEHLQAIQDAQAAQGE